eukprot:CAMPEP_0194289084 /NCGR_PEP_ID=MMETSP0169-20130528/38306_1 /TAXON_ID=218684 /ORGANISM="Corethron pennatum, Strain L29A3" /LENGTH=285 /DNA_ID=CAMNT_0039036271 /DNA_START=233 /DNA_END=1090 /DNA_ORIENTATION=+
MEHFHSVVELFSDIKCWPSSEFDGSKGPKEDKKAVSKDTDIDSPQLAPPEPSSSGKASVPNKRNESNISEQILTAERRLTNRNNRKTIFRSRGYENSEFFPTETKPYLVSCLLQNNLFNGGLCNYQHANEDHPKQSPSGPLHETPSAIIVQLSDDVDVNDGDSCIPEDFDYKSPIIPHVPIKDASSLDTVDLSLFDDERLDYDCNDCLTQKYQQMRERKKKKLRRRIRTEQSGERLHEVKLRYRPSLLLSNNDISKQVENIISKANRPMGSPTSVADVLINILDA